MFKKIFVVILLTTVTGCMCETDVQVKNNEDEKNKEYFFVGSENEESAFKKAYDSIDPATDVVVTASEYYNDGEYERSKQESLKAIESTNSKTVQGLAHRNLLRVYKTIGQYDLAIQEIDWLLENVNEYAKPDLIKQKEKLQELLKTQE